VAIWLDETMLATETAFMRHIITGLKSDGHRVTIVAPFDLDVSNLPILGSRVLNYRVARWERLGVLQRMRLSGVIEEFTLRPPDVLLVWSSADPTLIDLIQTSLIQKAASSADNGPAGIPVVAWCWDASELFRPLMNFSWVRHSIVSSLSIQQRIPANFRQAVTLIYPGVYCNETVACYDLPGQPPCLVSLDPLSDIKAYDPLIRACRKLADGGTDFLLFAYDTGREEHPIWQLASRLDLLDRMSFVPFQQEAEPLLLHGDLYLHVLPSSRVQYRTLEAMAKGLAVVTCQNHAADYLVDNQTCRVVPGEVSRPNADAWYAILNEMIHDRAKGLGIAKRGQQLMRDRHPMSRTILQLAGVCRQAAGTPLRLTSADR
jgi:glycosyltransferase involved in cell wall biosynthesis